MDQPDYKHWHWDKRVPIAFLFGLILQSGAVFYWASTVDNQIAANRESIQKLETRVDARDAQLSQQSTSIAVLVEQVTTLSRGIDRLQNEATQTNQLLREYLGANR